MITVCPDCAKHYSTGNFDSCPHCKGQVSRLPQRANKPNTRRKRAKATKTPKQVGKQRKTAKSHDFDSDTEHRRYQELSILEKAGVIQNLETQPKFVLMPKIKIAANGIHNGYTQRAEVYTADFRYVSNGMVFVEDVKGAKRSKTGQIKPYIKNASASNKVKDLMRIWANQGLHATHSFLFTVEHQKSWLYFNSNRTQLDFELIDYSEAA